MTDDQLISYLKNVPVNNDRGVSITQQWQKFLSGNLKDPIGVRISITLTEPKVKN